MCTTYIDRTKKNTTLEQNYDFYYGHGLVINNKRGIKKSNLEPNPYFTEWTSKYGSITFNQFARELPTCGMNEKGLAIALMQHENAVPEKKDNRPFLNELQWIQYQLDNFSSVPKMLEEIKRLRISMEIFPLHYTILDKNGDSAIIEFIDGELKIHQNLNLHILTNSDFDTSLNYAKETNETTQSNSSLGRFARIHKSFSDKKEFKDQFERLNIVNIRPKFSSLFKWLLKGVPPIFTYWSIIYDCQNMIIYFKTKDSAQIKKIRCSDFDYSSKTDVMILGHQ